MKIIKSTLLLFCCFSLGRLIAQPAFQVKKEGTGKQSIVFIPGFGCSGDVWKETVASYKQAYTCHILTMPGFGGAKPEAAPEISKWVTSIAAYIREQRLEKPVIVGHSMGGGMALLLAARYPDLIGKIVVVDALPCLSTIMNPNFKSDPHPDCGPFAARFTTLNDSAFYQMEQRSISALMTDSVHKKAAVDWGIRSDKETLGRIFCQFSNLDMRDSLGTITCPALILLETPFANMKPAVEAQYHGLHTGTLVYATKGLHFIMFDDPQWYNDQLARFIKQ